jgi:hypothetical protein
MVLKNLLVIWNWWINVHELRLVYFRRSSFFKLPNAGMAEANPA